MVSLLRFKAVCRRWRSIIESSNFIHRHATFQNSTSKFGNFIFQYRPANNFDLNYKPHFFVLSSCRGSEKDCGQWSYKNLGMSPHLSDDEDDYLDPYGRTPPGANMVGSCHGIICIHDAEPRNIILWNPATKKSRCLPKSLPLPQEFGVLQSEFVLFGFDCKTCDYKVLQITFFKIGNELNIIPKNKVQIYSLRSDSWRWCMDANFYSHTHKDNPENQGRYLNGSYYFVGKNFRGNEMIDVLHSYVHPERVIFSFNFSRESFRAIPVPDITLWPDVVVPAPYITSRLDVIGGDQGKIVYIAGSLNSTSKVYEVYALNDFDYSCSATNVENNEYSWSKLHMFTVNHPCGYSGYGPKAITKNGMFGFLCGYSGGLVFINLLTGEMKDIEVIDASLESEGVDVVSRADIYQESLVSIDSAVFKS
ncbi:F-box/kelch-repeat protein At3g23880-like isoform X1 [Papaver somniferum]|uniref:F-box/kelch-repeat protein At3g23880-like isoform X1 n=2 Tax=Papaver somniferum TaxID=3469 RepID=UPI000E6F84C8|nr:F-box/kelch-repeat protein At3g23880-like isoform X1 [Papaver somniferum]